MNDLKIHALARVDIGVVQVHERQRKVEEMKRELSKEKKNVISALGFAWTWQTTLLMREWSENINIFFLELLGEWTNAI